MRTNTLQGLALAGIFTLLILGVGALNTHVLAQAQTPQEYLPMLQATDIPYEIESSDSLELSLDEDQTPVLVEAQEPGESEQWPRPWDDMQVFAADYFRDAGFAHSPLLDYTQVIAEACYTYDMDILWFCIISVHESGAGTDPNATAYNAWGWQAYLGSDWTTSIWNYVEKFTQLYGPGFNSYNHLIYDPKGSYYVYF